MKIVAELSCNHLGSLDRALKLVDACAEAGADAVKLQVWTENRMVVDRSYVLPDGPWKGRNLWELYREAQTPWAWVPVIFDYAQSKKIEAFASVFDLEALDYLESIGCPRYKISSFEIVDVQLIKAVAKTDKPMVISTGMASATEIAMAAYAAWDSGCKDMTLLKCISAYPASPESAALRHMVGLAKMYRARPGLSDHSEGIGVGIAAAVLGAEILEKHVTLSRADGGPDANFSLEPDELVLLVKESKRAIAASCHQRLNNVEEEPQRRLRRSLYWARDMEAGETIKESDLISSRPALGLSPDCLPALIGRELCADVKAFEPVKGI